MISIGERVVVVVAVSVSVIVGAQVAAIFSPSFFSRSSGSFGFGKYLPAIGRKRLKLDTLA